MNKNESSNSLEKDCDEDSSIKNNVAVQLTLSEKEESGNVNVFTNEINTSTYSAVSSEQKQGKSILEKFLTRPLNSSFNDLVQYDKMDNRKVEPLKINLHREPIKTVIKIPPIGTTEPQQHSPKITIKPIKPPSSTQANPEVEVEQRPYKTHHKTSFETNDVYKTVVDLHTETHTVPKLTIKPILEPPIPKLTIKTTPSEATITSNSCDAMPMLAIRKKSHPSILSSSSSSNSDCTVVPKLTIKIDHQNCQEFSTKVDSNPTIKVHEKKNRQEEGMLTAEGVKLTIKPILEPPIPKLTIKTTPSDATISSNSCDTMPVLSKQKLLIKPIQQDCADIEIQSGSDENDSNENSVDGLEKAPIPKITLKTSSVDRIVSSDAIPMVPKLILKMGGNKIVCGDDPSQDDTYASKPAERNVRLTSENSSPEKASADLFEDNTIHSESDPVISLLDDSESNMESTEKFGNSPLSDDIALHSVSTKSFVRDNPDSPRIILKINKASTNEAKANTDASSSSSIVKQISVENLVSSTMTTEPELTDERMETNILAQPKTMKRTLAEIDSDGDLDYETKKTTKKSKVLDNVKDATVITVEEKNQIMCTLISDEDSNDIKTNEDEQGKEDVSGNCSMISEEKAHIESDCITIDDDSNSMEKQEDDKTAIDMNETAKSVSTVEEITDVTPVKRGRGRPKKIIQTPTKKQLHKENEMDHHTAKSEGSLEQKTEILRTPTRGRGRGRGRGGKTMEIVKDGKVLQVKMDAGYEDDDSPTFSIYNRYATTRGRGRGGRGKRGMGRLRKSMSNEGSVNPFDPNKTLNSLGDLKVSLQKLPSKLSNSGSLQLFEEDTLMGGDVFPSPFKNLPDFPDESQSSQLSSASATNEARERKRGKMEVCEPEGRTEFTVDLLAEYEWPPMKHGQKHRTSETYMVQEQISEYLGIKSFKRKYPDLVRRPVEMEERNFMMERGLVSEKMCDLGLTAVIASEILDIMCNDYPEKYEEYRRYQREKQFLELSHRQKLLRFEQENKGQQQKDKAIETAATWNAILNKERLQSRKSCIDLQTLVIQIPKSKSDQITAKNTRITEKTNYPISLVPGQFSEFFKSYSPEELACYPVNTVLIHHSKLNALLKEQQENLSDDNEESESESDDGSSSSSNYDSSENSSTSDDENKNDDSDPLCAVCDLTQYKNSYGHPEIFIECTACYRKAHPTCIKMPLKMVKRAMEYNWKCAECKNCSKCMRTTDESKMLFCAQCDRGYHIYCLGLRNVPDGQWHCSICSICTKCGTKSPEGNPNPLLTPNQRQNLAMVANWTHLYRTNNITKLREHYQTLCVPCAKLKNV